MVGYPLMLQQRRRPPTRWVARLCLLLTVGACFGLARSCLFEAWIYLTIPAGALLLSVLSLALMFPRAVRGLESWIYWPMRAAARRYAPWMLLVVSTLAATLYTLTDEDYSRRG